MAPKHLNELMWGAPNYFVGVFWIKASIRKYYKGNFSSEPIKQGLACMQGVWVSFGHPNPQKSWSVSSQQNLHDISVNTCCGWYLNKFQYPLKSRTPPNCSITNSGHPVSEYWLRQRPKAKLISNILEIDTWLFESTQAPKTISVWFFMYYDLLEQGPSVQYLLKKTNGERQ